MLSLRWWKYLINVDKRSKKAIFGNLQTIYFSANQRSEYLIPYLETLDPSADLTRCDFAISS